MLPDRPHQDPKHVIVTGVSVGPPYLRLLTKHGEDTRELINEKVCCIAVGFPPRLLPFELLLGAPSMFYNTSIFPLPDNVVHFRAWVWFESSWENHITFAAVGPLPIEEWGDEIRFGGQHGKYYVNQAPSDSFSPNPWECTDCIAPTPETWTCLRGMFDFGQRQATLHVDDSIAVDLARDGWRNNEEISFPANPERFGLGFIDHNGSGPITAYFDDVALGYEPIPCE